MEDTTRRTLYVDEACEAWAVVERDPATSDGRRVLLLVVRRSEALQLVRALCSRGINATVVAITDLDGEAILAEPA